MVSSKEKIRNCPQELKELAYLFLLRSQLECTCVAYDPYKTKDISNLEKVQRKPIWFIKQDYSKYNSVTRMTHELNWKNLEDRRKDIKLTMP